MTLKEGSKDSLLKDANKQRKRWPIKNIRTRKAPAGLYRVLSKWMDSKSRIPQSILFIYSVLASVKSFGYQIKSRIIEEYFQAFQEILEIPAEILMSSVFTVV